MKPIAASGNMNPAVLITLWVLLKDGDRAMEVARGLKEGEIFEAEIMFTPTYAVLREHPEFPELLDAIGLTEYSRKNTTKRITSSKRSRPAAKRIPLY